MGLPVIDISGLRGSMADRRAVAASLRAACVINGFFYISGHGVPEAELDGLFRQARGLFALPDSAKQAVAGQRHGDRGYARMGTVASAKEEYYAARETPAGPAQSNRWPAGVPGFQAAVLAHIERMHDIAALLMTGFALSLDLPEDHFAAFCTDPIAALRIVRYPAGAPGTGAHTDYGSLTLLLQDGVGGLQVLDRLSGDWIDAPPIPGTFVVNVGDLFERWTNGLYRSTLHRVDTASNRERFSAPFFLTGAADHPIVCLPSCLAPGEAPLHPPTSVGEHLRARFAAQVVTQ
ncbi:2OG-Fe(II) oxygenase family protein [Iodidimonas sp. SYSU 1G8]|uniref:isopenicillin N synthase family dioxygenase n=1 Tax=Iodidimonas sp. SYSU 1G8 TaxID=3133967 RepID=UPI0031FEEB4B